MRKHVAVLVLVVASLLLGPVQAAAQNRHPHAGSLAFGYDLGLYIPNEDLHAGFLTQVLAEFYITHNISLRGTGGWSQTGYQGSNEKLEQVRGTFSLLFNWEQEAWHPFVMVGGGYYGIQHKNDIEHTGWTHRWGTNFGGGIEYFARPSITIKVEGTYHWVDENQPAGQANGFALTAGLKKYF